ncbi:MAG TPA: hypothetical protein VKY74_04865, partial [Chloroflexia bacterium]|nr:hypothetical protein [Chloroflexia bacterium]
MFTAQRPRVATIPPARPRPPHGGLLVLAGLLAGLVLLGLAGGPGRVQAATPVAVPAPHVSPPKYPPALFPPPAAPTPPWTAHYSGGVPTARGPRAPHPVQPTDVVTGSWTNRFPDLYAVSATSSDDAWAAGEYGHLLHYTGGAWTASDPPALRGVNIERLKMLSATSGWASTEYQAFQYDGTTWQERSTGLTDTLSLGTIAPAAPNDVWATLSYDSAFGEAELAHWTGTRWITASLGLTDTVLLEDITMLSPSDGWAAGTEFKPEPSPARACLFHYDGAHWTVAPAPPGAAYLYNIWANASGELWALGAPTNSPTFFYHYSAGAWTGWAAPPNVDPYALAMADSSNGWATGAGGILHWDGTAWTVEYQGRTTYALAAAPGAA